MIATGTVSSAPVFDETRHLYFLDGKHVPSVSRILRPITSAAYGTIDKDVLLRAAEFGTAVHACTEFLDEGELDDSSLQPEWIPYVDAYKKWHQDMHPTILNIECRFACSKYAGTIDRIVRIDGEDWIVDIKTTSEIHPHVGLQLAAYEALVRNFTGTSKRLRRAALQLRGDGSYRFKVFNELGDYACFSALLNIYAWIKKHEH